MELLNRIYMWFYTWVLTDWQSRGYADAWIAHNLHTEIQIRMTLCAIDALLVGVAVWLAIQMITQKGR